MNDTRPDIEIKVREMLQQKSPVERFKMGMSMCETSRYLVIRSILENAPTDSPANLRQQLFLKFYRSDFNSSESQRILDHLERVSTK